MAQWLIIITLYVLGFRLFAVIGGMSSAGEAFRSWGESVSGRRTRATSRS